MDKRISNWDHFMNVLKLTIFAVMIILVAFFLLGCAPEPPRKVATTEGMTFPVTVIDGCEYLVCRTTHAYYVASHKGNCTNSIHVYRMENK